MPDDVHARPRGVCKTRIQEKHPLHPFITIPCHYNHFYRFLPFLMPRLLAGTMQPSVTNNHAARTPQRQVRSRQTAGLLARLGCPCLGSAHLRADCCAPANSFALNLGPRLPRTSDRWRIAAVLTLRLKRRLTLTLTLGSHDQHATATDLFRATCFCSPRLDDRCPAVAAGQPDSGRCASLKRAHSFRTFVETRTMKCNLT